MDTKELIRVKPLEWVRIGKALVAQTTIGGYEVIEFEGDGLCTRLRTPMGVLSAWHLNEADALSAAQADFESLILPAIDATALRLLTEEVETLKGERDEARALVTEANNSLYGSQGYFHSTNGGPFDKYHLARPIEELKSQARAKDRAETAAASLRQKLEVAREALKSARETIIDLVSARSSEAEGTPDEWVADIDAALTTLESPDA